MDKNVGTVVSENNTIIRMTDSPVDVPTVTIPEVNVPEVTVPDAEVTTEDIITAVDKEETKAVISEAADSVVETLDTASLIEEAKKNEEIAEDAEVEIRVQPSIKVEVAEVKKTEEVVKSVVYDIKAVYQVVAVAGETQVVVQEEKAMDMTEKTIDITLPIPAALQTIEDLCVVHTKDNGKKHVYSAAKNNDGTITFTNPNGFSTFEVKASEPVLSAMADAGFYAATADAEEKNGIIAFKSVVENYDSFKDAITGFGFYIYRIAGHNSELSNGSAEDLATNNGAFIGKVTNIPSENFDALVYAKPYVTTDTGVHFGDIISTTVNTIKKWLGSEAE